MPASITNQYPLIVPENQHHRPLPPQQTLWTKLISVLATSETLSSNHYLNRIRQVSQGGWATLNAMFSIKSLSRPPDEDVELKEICQQGAQLMAESERICQLNNASETPSSPLRLTTKQAVLGGIIFSGAAASACLFFKWYCSQRTDSTYSAQEQVATSDMSDIHLPRLPALYRVPASTPLLGESTISVTEYRQALNIINQLSVPELSRFVITDPKRRSTRELSEKYLVIDYIPNHILAIVQDDQLDWRFRNEFDLIFRRAEISSDVRNSHTKKERSIKLLLKCIQFTDAFLDENEKQIPNSRSYPLGKIALERLCKIASNINDIAHIKITHYLHPAPCQTKKYDHHYDNQKIIKLTLPNDNLSPDHLYRDKKIHLPKNKTTEQPNIDNVKISSMIECYNEREDLNTSSILRVISKALMYPVTSTIHEGMVIFQYQYLGEGCRNNERFIKTSQKIESKINELLSQHPRLGKVRASAELYSHILDMQADAIDNKEMSLSKVAGVEESSRSLFKTLISSLSTFQTENYANEIPSAELNSMVSKLKLKKDKIFIQTKKPDKIIETRQEHNHFANTKNGNFILYENSNSWVENKDVKLNHVIKKTLTQAYNMWGKTDKITFIKNSSPIFYQDAILISDADYFYALIEGRLSPVKEVRYNDKDYRYLTSKKPEDYSIPLVYKGEEWCAEDETSSVVSDSIINFIRDPRIKNNLASKNIHHEDVSPLTLGRRTQIDKNNNHYIKIDNQYYLLKMNNAASVYIEGENNLLLLTDKQEQFVIRAAKSEGVIAMSREKIINPLHLSTDKETFMDESILVELHKIDLVKNSPSLQKINHLNIMNMSHSKSIDGALSLNGIEYFNIDGFLIKVKYNGDDTYTLFNDDPKIFQPLTIYKNIKSNTYYLKKTPTEPHSVSVRKRNSCIVKRQILSLCSTQYYESADLTSLLTTNQEHAIQIDNTQTTLEKFKDINGIYYNKSTGDLFYSYKNNLYFHISEELANQPDLTPPFFSIYGKKDNGEINFSYFITSVCILKDFDTKTVIMGTPLESQRIILGINSETSAKMLKWNKSIFHGKEISTEELAKLSSSLSERDSLPGVQEIFNNGGKKIISNLEEVNESIMQKVKEINYKNERVKLLKFDSVLKDMQPEQITEIYDAAFKNAVSILKSAKLKKQNAINYYCNEELNISDKKVQELFYHQILKRIDRLSVVLDESDKSNILLITRELPEPLKSGAPPSWEPNTLDKNTVLGYAMANDPLDRIILNTLFIPKGFDPAENSFTGFQQQSQYINLMTETMIHEAVHAIGDPKELAYIIVNDAGRMLPVREAIDYLEVLIASDKMMKGFIDLSKLYFSSNPVYHGFNIEDLLRPYNLREIYLKDNYYKALLLLNTPDLLTLIIRDISELR